MHLTPRALGAALLLNLSISVAGAQSGPTQPTSSTSDTRISVLLDSLSRVRTPVSAAISPDGNLVAWTVSGSRGSELHLTSLARMESSTNAARERVLSPDTIAEGANGNPGACTGSHPAWSPDGKQLAFLSNCSGNEGNWKPTPDNNVFVWTLAVNAVKQVTQLQGGISSMAWSPNGQAIGFLFVEHATRSAGALDAMKPWSGVIGEDGVEVQRVSSVDLATDASAWLTPAYLHVYEFAWAPDSRHIAFVAANPPGENNWWIANLYSADFTRHTTVSNGDVKDRVDEEMHTLLDPQVIAGPLHGLQIAVPRFSPDGKHIAFIGGLMSDQGSTGGDIYVIPATGIAQGGEPRDVTSNRPASPAWISWRNNHSLLVSEHVGGSTHVAALDVATGKDDPAVNLTLPESIIAGPDVMSLSLAAHSANVAVIRQSFDWPPEVWAGPLSEMKQLTHLNDALKPVWGKSESIDYTNEGFRIQGWLLYPANYDPASKYPLIVSVHGGPSSAMMPRWPGVGYGSVPFSALGYFVFMPNPRGSYGQGEKFTQANIKDFGYGDMRDVLAGMDVLERRVPIDKNREGLTGWSYGGFMTMFGVTQTTRFKAAVAGAGISDWQSYYGENSIDQWMVPFFGATVYDTPAIYAKSSAIDFIKRVKTPTLVVVGDRDGECPAPQSFEFWHALRAEGVKTQLVVYPDEGHRFVNPEHQRDVLKRALDWFETEMPAK
jgi:dipeptidyl aminopeptidase/acylaminoacyl peptidase